MARRVRKSRADIQRWNQMVSSLRLMNMAFTNVRLYPPTHPEVVGTVTQLHQTIHPMVEEMEDIGYGFMDQMLYIEGAMSLEETAKNEMLVDRFSRCRVKYLTFMKDISVEHLLTFFQILNAEATKPSEEHPREILEKKGVQTIHIVEAELDESESKGKLVKKKTLLDWYEKSVSTLKSVQDQYQEGSQAVDLKPLYRLMEDLSATIRNKGHEPFLLLPILGRGLDPHAAHSVNVGIYSCVLGEFYGLNSGQINSLCASAFLHDVGRAALPPGLASKKDPLTAEEKSLVSKHGLWGGLLLLARQDLSPQIGLIALKHQDGFRPVPDGASYQPDIFHKIIELADSYDMAVRSDKYYWRRHNPARTLRWILNHRGTGQDPTLVKLLANAVGFYPPGSLVQLEDGQHGIVVRPNLADSARPKIFLHEIPTEDDAPPVILDVSEINEDGTGFKCGIAKLVSASSGFDIHDVLDKKKEFLLSHSL